MDMKRGIAADEEGRGNADSGMPDAKKRKRVRKNRSKKKICEHKAGTVVKSDRDVYVTGLPKDITKEELVSFFSKCGIIRKTPQAEPIVKIYTDASGNPKGDGLISYFKKESVELAMTILDETEIRPGFKVMISPAEYTMKEMDENELKAKRAQSLALGKGRGGGSYNQSKELEWDAEGEKHVVLRGMFTLDEVYSQTDFVKELKEDIREEAETLGKVESVAVFEFNPEGIAVIKFADSYAAEKCVKLMDGRFFSGRQIKAELYDGYSNFKVEETEEMKQKRIQKWHDDIDNN